MEPENPSPPDAPVETAEEERQWRRDFRRGNINFDFLQPEGFPEGAGETREPFVERRGGKREGKRGLFDRGRPPRPAGRLMLVAWGALFAASLAGAVALFILQRHSIWTLFFPFTLAIGVWSLIMLALLKARPR